MTSVTSDYTSMGPASPTDSEAKDIEQSLISVGDEGHDHLDLPERGSLRRRILTVLLSKNCEILLLILLAADVILVMAELEIATKVVCQIEWAEVDREVSNATFFGNRTIKCAEAREKAKIEFSCANQRVFTLPYEYAACPFSVKEELPHGLEIAEKAVSWTSRSIIIFFALELLLLLICGGPMLFWQHKMYLLDAFVVGISVIFDAVAVSTDMSALAELIVIARCWRFARIIHGVGAGVHENKEHGDKKEGGGGGDGDGHDEHHDKEEMK